MALLLITSFVHIPHAALAITTFSASTGGSASFSGDSTEFLQVTNETTTSLNMADSNDFTIAWWQNSIVVQSPYPRILQFGHGHEYENKFAISEEYDNGWDRIILWINGMMITNIINPSPESSAWHHIAITRNGNDFSWFIDGVFLYSVNNEVENFNTSNLDLLIGSGDDQGTGGFSGNLSGVQISKSVRWETATVFTPPIDFQNPGSGLAFSMYVSQSAVIDKSGNNLVVLPKPNDFVGFLDDFNPPNLTPTPTAPDSPTSVSATDGEDASTTVSWTAPVSDGGSAITEYSATTASGQTCTSNDTECQITGLTNGSSYTFTVTASNAIGTSAPSSASASITPTSPIPVDWSQYPSKFHVDDPGQNESDWGQELRVYKDESAPDFDFNRIKHVSIGVPVNYSGSTDIKCYLKVPDPDTPVTDNNERSVGLWKFQDFISAFNNPTFSNCEGSEIPDYQYGMFGETQTTVSVYLWTQETVTDFSEIESAFEELQINLNLPSHISIQSITRGDNVETDPSRISFGDTITVTVENESATAYMAMLFALPESGNAANICRYYLDTIDGSDIYGRTFPLPTLDDLLSYCREQYEGDWEFDIEAERSFSIVAFDGGDNYSVASDSQLILNPKINWSLYPSRVSVSYPTWNKIYTFSKDEDDETPYFNYRRITDITIGIPVTYVAANEALVDTICYLRIDDDGEEFWADDNGLRLQLFQFPSVINRLPDCISASDAEHPDGWFDHIVSIGILGESHTTISVQLWADDENDFEFPEKAFEVVNVNVNFPPLISGHTITRINNSETDDYIIHSGDIVHFSFVNSSSEIENMDFIVEVPEAYYAGQVPSESGDYLCWVNIEPNLVGVFGESVTVPSAAQISTQCHLEYDGGWIFDESITRSILIGVDDTHGNSIPSYQALTLAAQTQAPEPDRTAPPTAEPTPPKKIILSEPTPEPPAPTPTPVTVPSAPTPDPIVITPEPVVVEVVVPVAVIESAKIEVVTEVSIQSELPAAEKPIKIALVAKACARAGVWIFTKSNLLQICDTKLKPVLVIPACTGKKATPTFPWIFKAQRFKPGYSSTQSGQKLYYSVFFFKGLAIAGVDKVSNSPCSNGSVFIEKKHAKQVYTYIVKNKSLIWVKS